MNITTESNRKFFGNYLRKLREDSSAQSYGFKTLTVRRTPGLRREELAQLCEVSTTWITLLEQGRATRPSLKLIKKISNQLKLNKTQSDYFLDLYLKAYTQVEVSELDYNFLNSTSPLEYAEITNILVNLVNSFSHPAYIINPKWDMICWNSQISTLFEGWLETNNFFSDDKNLLNYIFLNENSKVNLPDWEYRTKRSVAEFRNDCAQYDHLPSIKTHISYLLLHSIDFKKLWLKQDIMHREGVIKSFKRDNGELIYYRQISTKVEAFPALRLILLLPEA